MWQQKNDDIDILIITDNGLETTGGEQESTKIILSGVKKHYSLGVIQPGNINQPISDVHYYPLTSHTRIKHLIKKPLEFVRYIWQVRKIIKKEKPKIIHTQAQISFFLATLFKKYKLIPSSISLVHTERGLYNRYNWIFKKIFYYCLKELNTLITTTYFNMNSWKHALEKKNFFLNYKVIENTAGELFENCDENRVKKHNSHLVIGFAGRYSEQKNWPLAVEISKKLNKYLGENFSVNMAVGALDNKSELKTKELFNEMSTMLNSRFQGLINVDLETMNDFYYNIDVFILTSLPKSESFGRTIVEAMSRGTAVLTTKAGGPEEVVNSPENICESVDDFVESVLTFFNDEEGLSKEKKNNFAKVKKKYSFKNNIQKHLDLYTDIELNDGN